MKFRHTPGACRLRTRDYSKYRIVNPGVCAARRSNAGIAMANIYVMVVRPGACSYLQTNFQVVRDLEQWSCCLAVGCRVSHRVARGSRSACQVSIVISGVTLLAALAAVRKGTNERAGPCPESAIGLDLAILGRGGWNHSFQTSTLTRHPRARCAAGRWHPWLYAGLRDRRNRGSASVGGGGERDAARGQSQGAANTPDAPSGEDRQFRSGDNVGCAISFLRG